jgi:DNA-binding response OmpR family regulator
MVGSGSPTTLPVALGFQLDLIGHRLQHGESEVRLRPREFQLLATLAANPGRAMTRRQLVDLAWRPDRDVDLRAVDVHVHWLRAKIETRPRHPAHLVTVRGYGYRLDPESR